MQKQMGADFSCTYQNLEELIEFMLRWTPGGADAASSLGGKARNASAHHCNAVSLTAKSLQRLPTAG